MFLAGFGLAIGSVFVYAWCAGWIVPLRFEVDNRLDEPAWLPRWPTVLVEDLKGRPYQPKVFYARRVGFDAWVLDGVMKMYHPNRQLARSGVFVADQKHGEFSEWTEEGQRKSLRPYYDDQLHGTLVSWHDNGVKALETNYRNGQMHGELRRWAPNGVMTYQALRVDGDLHGQLLRWHENKQVEVDETYEAGVLHGVSRRFYPDGTLEEIRKFDHGRKIGVHKGWFENGTLQWEETYDPDQLDRRVIRTWNVQGVVTSQGVKEGEKRVGMWIQRHSNGKIQARIQYGEDGIAKFAEFFHKNGRLRMAGAMATTGPGKGKKPIGCWTSYDQDGNVIAVVEDAGKDGLPASER